MNQNIIFKNIFLMKSATGLRKAFNNSLLVYPAARNATLYNIIIITAYHDTLRTASICRKRRYCPYRAMHTRLRDCYYSW